MKGFQCKTKIISGDNAVCALKEMGIKRLLLVTDPYFAKNGEAERLAKETGALQTEIFDNVQPDPNVKEVAEGEIRMRKFRPDTIVCLGGGSAIDCGKAIRFFGKENIKLVAIPTTSGSGSEVTDFAVITHEKIKYPLVDSSVYPDVAILDSTFLSDMPASLIADSGFDVISHALEGMVAKNSGTLSETLSKEAFRITYTLLLRSFNGEQNVRLKIHEASCMAGLAFSHAGLGICHALSHAIGGMFHVPHGRLNAILLPYVVDCNAAAIGNKYAAAARYAGIAGSTDTVAVRNLRNGIIRLRRELRMPETLLQAGVEPESVREKSHNIVKAAMEDTCYGTNPVPVDESSLMHIIKEVTYSG